MKNKKKKCEMAFIFAILVRIAEIRNIKCKFLIVIKVFEIDVN